MIKNEKESDWHKFVSREGASDPWGKVYRICMGRLGKESLAGPRTPNGYTRTWGETAGVLMNEFFPAGEGIPIPPEEDTPTPEPAAGLASRGRSADGNPACEFSKREFNYAVSRMRMGNSPGMDAITNAMALQVAKSAPSFMKAMYSFCLSEGLFPKKWKEARVVALLKGADKDRAEPRSYRPISLLSGLGKILERMLIERLLRCIDGK